MTIYILYHNIRNAKIPQWNYIPDAESIPHWKGNIDQFDFTLVESMPNTDVVYARLEDVPIGSKWIYAINNLYSNSVYEQHGLDVFDHFLSIPRLMNDLLAGNGRILFDDRREGYLYDNYVDGQISQFFTSKQIPLDRVIFATGTANADSIFDSRKYKMQSLYIRQFEIEASRLLKNSTYLPDRLPIKRFLCFNRRYAYRLHRLQFLSLIYQNNLLQFFYYSMLDGVDNISVIDAAKSLIGLEPDHFKTYDTMLKLNDKMPMLLDTDDLHTNLATTHHTSDVESYYNKTAISIVVETLFYESEIFFSEKLWHPIRMSQPFILIGGAGSLKHLHNLGYKTFSQWWDESYDTIIDPHQRMEAVVAVIKQISKWSEFQLSVFMAESADVCSHNLNHLHNMEHTVSYNCQLERLFDN